MVLSLAISAQPNIVLYGYILTIICMFTVVVPQDLHSPGITGGSRTFGQYMLKGCDPRSGGTHSVLWVFFSSFPFWKSSPHAVICKMSHAVLSYMSWSITPCTRTYTWVRDVTIWALDPDPLPLTGLCLTSWDS